MRTRSLNCNRGLHRFDAVELGLCGGSRARAWSATGDVFGADPLCEFPQPGA